MHLLSTSEALCVSDSFLSSLYGDDIFRRWKYLKDEMKFATEREYVSWLIDAANHYKQIEDESKIRDEVSDCYMEQNDKGVDICSDRGVEVDLVKSEVDLDESYTEQVSQCRANIPTSSGENEDLEFSEPKKMKSHYNNKHEASNYTPADEEHSYTDYYYQGAEVENFDEGRQGGKQEGETCTSGEIAIAVSNDDTAGQNNPEYPNSNSGPEPQLQHQLQMDSSSNKRYKCPHCFYSTNAGYQRMNQHISVVHQHRKPLSCNYCQYQTAQGFSLKAHLICKHGYKSEHYCASCQKYFPSPSHLHKHAKNCSQLQ